MNRTVSAISLFSGCGGTDLALQRNGFAVKWANDIWAPACDTYKDNLKNPKIQFGDIADFERFPRAQLLVGCYPCQGYSQGGKRAVDAEVNYLYRHFDRVLRTVEPRAFVVENVNGMVYGENRELLQNQLLRYRSAGYRVTWSVLDAKDYGVPQTRRRIFIVGIRSDLRVAYEFPDPTHGPGRTNSYVTQREAIGQLPGWPEGEFCPDELHWYYLSRNRRATWSKPSPCIVGHWRHVPLHPSSPPLEKKGRDKWRFSRKGRARRLSYRECAALQGFPLDWKWNYGSVRLRYQLVGNAVPPPLFSAVVKALPNIWR
jgi:DNA (cytosine-5)-methyltransferase 1